MAACTAMFQYIGIAFAYNRISTPNAWIFVSLYKPHKLQKSGSYLAVILIWLYFPLCGANMDDKS